MISTFDPLSGPNGRWVYHELTSVRDITACKSCLYRGPGVTETAVDMAFEVDKIKRIFHSINVRQSLIYFLKNLHRNVVAFSPNHISLSLNYRSLLPRHYLLPLWWSVCTKINRPYI